MSREYTNRVPYGGFFLAEWTDSTHGVPQHRWDVLDPSSEQVITTLTDRLHAESFVDAHLHEKSAPADPAHAE